MIADYLIFILIFDSIFIGVLIAICVMQNNRRKERMRKDAAAYAKRCEYIFDYDRNIDGFKKRR